MGMKYWWIATIIATLAIGASRCQDECEAAGQFAGGSTVCGFPENCCTRLQCPISIPGLSVDVDLEVIINPCSTPTTLDILATSGDSVLVNMSGISTSQSIPIRFGGVLDTSIDLFFNSSMDSVTIGLSTFGITLLPPTTIPVSTNGCTAGTSQPPACSVTPAPGLATQPGPPPVSDGTCQALLQLAGGRNIASSSNNCQVNRQCTTVNCNDYLGLYDFMLVLLTCNDPPGIMFIAYDDANNLVFNETITDSRTIPLGDFGDIIGTVDHPCGQEAIIVQVVLSTSFSNATVFPATVIPIDQSDCTSVAATITPCNTEAPTSFNDVCDAVQSGIQSSASTCMTNYPDCTTTTCNLDAFNIPFNFGYTILPCTAVPSVRFTVVNDGMMIVDETLSESQVQSIRVGPTNVSVRFVVQQDPPLYRNIGVGVNLISSDPEIDVPVFPLTQIPLDRCDCSNISCSNANQGGGNTQQPDNNNDSTRIIIPAVIAAVLFVALVVAMVVSVVFLVLVRQKQKKSLQHSSVTYKNLQNQEDLQQKEIED